MLEVNYSSQNFNLQATFFLKTVVFFESKIEAKSIASSLLSKSNFFCLKSVKKFFGFYKSSILNLMPDESIFDSKIKISKSLSIIAKLFKNEEALNAFFNHFQISFTDSNLKEISKSEKHILCFAPFFLKESLVWQIFIEDEIVSQTQLKLIEIMMTSKISHSNSIIFYQTRSGKPLNIPNQISFFNP